MTTQEINRYITVANNWERKYSNLAKKHDKFLSEECKLIENQQIAINQLTAKYRRATELLFCSNFVVLVLFICFLQ